MISRIFKIDSLLVLLIIISLWGGIVANAQVREKRTGRVSFISSSHIYIQFDQTDRMNIGDTLYIQQGSNYTPAMRIKFLSSRSCAADKLIEHEISINDSVTAFVFKQAAAINISPAEKDTVVQALPETSSVPRPEIKKKMGKNTWGKFSIQSLSNLSNSGPRENFQRWRYSFSLGADSLAGSGFGFSSYLFFAYNTRDWQAVKSNIGKALKIYDLSLSYKIGMQNRVWAGRHLNNRISNIGSIDGLQFEHESGRYYLGGIVGSHPDFSDYGYNAKMFEYGAYAGRIDSISGSRMENTIAFFNQTNNFITDRRYVYYQHTNNILKRTNFFASAEVDLFKKESGVSSNSATLTSLYLSLYINPADFLSLSFSYDARRNVVYYETYKSYIDSLFTNEMRQGYRMSLIVRPTNRMMLSINGGYRFQKNDIKPSRNFGGNLYFSGIPFLDLNANASYTKLISSYTEGSIAGLRLSKFITSAEINVSLDLRRTEYNYNFNIEPVVQNSAGLDVSCRLPFNLYLGLNYEGVFEKQRSFGRFFLDLTKRF